MTAPIKAVYVESADYVIDASSRQPGQVKWWLHIPIALAVGAVVALRVYFDRDRTWPYWFAAGAILYSTFISTPFRRWQMRRWYKKETERQNQTVTWEFSKADILQLTTIASSRFDWSFARKIIEHRDGFLLYTPEKSFFWIPRASLANADDFEKLAALFRSKVSDYKKV